MSLRYKVGTLIVPTFSCVIIGYIFECMTLSIIVVTYDIVME